MTLSRGRTGHFSPPAHSLSFLVSQHDAQGRFGKTRGSQSFQRALENSPKKMHFGGGRGGGGEGKDTDCAKWPLLAALSHGQAHLPLPSCVMNDSPCLGRWQGRGGGAAGVRPAQHLTSPAPARPYLVPVGLRHCRHGHVSPAPQQGQPTGYNPLPGLLPLGAPRSEPEGWGLHPS